MTDPQAIAARLSEAQKRALIQCVDALSELAGEGFCTAEEAIFELFSAFDGNPDLAYEQWVRSILGESNG